MTRSTRIAFALAAILAVGMVGTASAATTSSTTAATVTVDASISMSGIPATIAFGNAVGGATLQSSPFSIVVVSSENFTVTAAATNFTGGGFTIPASALNFITNGSDLFYGAAGSTLTLGTTTPLAEKVAFTIPPAAHAATYSGVITWTASN